MNCPNCNEKMYFGFIKLPYAGVAWEFNWQIEGLAEHENLKHNKWSPQIQYFHIIKPTMAQTLDLKKETVPAWGCLQCKAVVILPEDKQ